MRRGIHTSEFWLSVLAILCLTALVIFDKITIEIALGILGASGVYTVSRGIAKMGGVERAKRKTVLEDQDRQRGPRSPLPAIVATALLASASILPMSIGLVGCATGTGSGEPTLNPRRVEAIAKLAAYTGVTADLRVHPERRAAYIIAQRALGSLIAEERWDIGAVASVLVESGIGEMEGSEGQIAFVGGLMLVDAMGIGTFERSDSEHVRALLIGLEEGIGLALHGPALRGDLGSHRAWITDLRSEAEATRTLPPSTRR